MEHLYIPPDYKSELSLYDTQVAIKTVKDFFQKALAEQQADHDEPETYNYKETASVTTGLGDLLKGLKL